MVFLLTVFAALVSQNATAQSGTSQSVQEALKTLVSNSQLKLGDLEPWQKKIFVEEAVPQYSRFIRDYRVSGSSVQAEVDVEILKKYLAFHINPKDNKKQEVRMGLYVRGDSDCEKCNQSGAKLRALAQTRLERRGFVPLFISAEDLGSSVGKTLEERALAVAARKGWIGVTLIQTSIAPPDPLDTAHADEKDYLTKTTLLIPTFQVKQEGQLRILESESMEMAAARLLTDTFTDLGTRILASASLKPAEEQGEEFALVVSGVRDFHQFSQVKMMLQTKLQTLAAIEERRMMRGRVVFALRTEKSIPEIRSQIATLTIDQARWSLIPEANVGPDMVRLIDSGAAIDKTIHAEIQ